MTIQELRTLIKWLPENTIVTFDVYVYPSRMLPISNAFEGKPWGCQPTELRIKENDSTRTD